MCRRVVFLSNDQPIQLMYKCTKDLKSDSYQFIHYIAVNKNKSYIDPCLILYKYVAICPILNLKTSFEPRHMAPGTIWQRLGHTFSSRDSGHSSQKHMPRDSTHCQYILSVYKLTPNWWKPEMEKGSKGSAVVVKSQSGQNTKLN